MVVRDSLVHEVDVTRFLFDEEIASIQIVKPAANLELEAGTKLLTNRSLVQVLLER